MQKSSKWLDLVRSDRGDSPQDCRLLHGPRYPLVLGSKLGQVVCSWAPLGKALLVILNISSSACQCCRFKTVQANFVVETGLQGCLLYLRPGATKLGSFSEIGKAVLKPVLLRTVKGGPTRQSCRSHCSEVLGCAASVVSARMTAHERQSGFHV